MKKILVLAVAVAVALLIVPVYSYAVTPLAPMCAPAGICKAGTVSVGPAGPRGPAGAAGAVGPAGPAGAVGPASCTGEGCLTEKVYFKHIDVPTLCRTIGSSPPISDCKMRTLGEDPPLLDCDDLDVSFGGTNWRISPRPPMLSRSSPPARGDGVSDSAYTESVIRMIVICADISSLLE